MVDLAFRYYVARYKVEAICQKKKKKRKENHLIFPLACYT